MKRTIVLFLGLLLAGCASGGAAPMRAELPAGHCENTAECGAGQTCRGGACVICSPVCNLACVRGSHCAPDPEGCMACVPDLGDPDAGT